MNPLRKQMNLALKKVIVPELRKHGFKGSLPHFRRLGKDHIDLVTFQFNKYGGSFVVEVAISAPEGHTMYWGEYIPPNKITAHHINKRRRIKPLDYDRDDWWFSYESAKTDEDFEAVAESLLRLLELQDEAWIPDLIKNK